MKRFKKKIELNSWDGNILVFIGLVLSCLTIILVTWYVRNKEGRDFLGHPRQRSAITATSVSSEGQPSGTSAFGEHPKALPGALDSEQ
ncbi:hypothetical protein EB052_01245 [bacterium]|nr:hypothetical protein [bacterium]